MSEYKVYKITNTVNGKSYIGMTTRRICDRWEEHVANSKGKRKRSSKFYTAIAEFGPKVFIKDILCTVATKEEAKAAEAKYISEFDTYNDGYNSNFGGAGFAVFPRDIVDKIQESHRIRKLTGIKRSDIPPEPYDYAKMELYQQSGAANPLAKTYRVRCPNGEEVTFTGLKDFCREHDLLPQSLLSCKNHRGYSLLAKLND